MDSSVLLHMNDDHQDALLDYCRHYGGAPYAITQAELTPNTKASVLEIAYRVGGTANRRGTCTVAIRKVSDDLRSNLVVMAKEASLARIPPFQLPGPQALGLIAALAVLLVVTFAPTHALQTGPLAPVWRNAAGALDFVGGRKTGRGLALFTLFAHVSEAALVLYKLLQVKKVGGRGRGRIALWVAQTVLCGFPSTTLVLGKLQAAEDARRRKDE